jgi:hypothetical protein
VTGTMVRSQGYRVAEEQEDMLTGKCHAPPSRVRSLARLGDGATALDKTNYDHDHRNDEENMDETAERIGGTHP